jgi:UDP-N-acetylmuramoylalanine--D-glutamate ligase
MVAGGASIMSGLTAISITLAGRRITVLGAGRSGRAAVRFLVENNSKVFLSDQALICPQLKRELAAWGIEYEDGSHSERALKADLIITSPGVPYRAPLLKEARQRGIPVLGELELAYRFCPSRKIIAVTGTVGKTTTVHLIAKLLRAHGHRVVVAGNIGQPFTEALAEIKQDTVVVLEVSSFQLEHVCEFKPHIGVFTRFAPHHLDRHGTLENYFAVKCRLFDNQTEGDFAVVQCDIVLPNIHSQLLEFSAEDLRLDLPYHQRENLAGALKAARLIDPSVTLESIDVEESLKLPHRLEFVAEVDGVRFYNDSKATSPEATLAAISSFEGPLVLIAGGYDDGSDLRELVQAVCERKVLGIFLLGQTAGRWEKMLLKLGYRRLKLVQSLDEAMELALEIGPRVCLFSPAAPSFDQFQNYAERGERFKQAVSYRLNFCPS